MLRPSTSAMMESSGPVSFSSTMTVLPAWPNDLSTMIVLSDWSAFSIESGTMAPLPAARPDALMTGTSSRDSMYWHACW